EEFAGAQAAGEAEAIDRGAAGVVEDHHPALVDPLEAADRALRAEAAVDLEFLAEGRELLGRRVLVGELLDDHRPPLRELLTAVDHGLAARLQRLEVGEAGDVHGGPGTDLCIVCWLAPGALG